MYDYSFFVRRENKLPHYFLVILNSMSKMRKAILFFLKKVMDNYFDYFIKIVDKKEELKRQSGETKGQDEKLALRRG